MGERATNAVTRGGRGDWLVMLAIAAGSAALLQSLPHALGNSDESYFLLEAKRVADGEVMYGDVFEFIPPGATYIMAAAFRLFGADMATARGVMAAVHAPIAVLLYATCQHLDVGCAFAAVVPLAYLALCRSAWPYAGWHWFSTLFLVAQSWLLSRSAWRGTPREAALAGLLSGASIGVQHQRGLPVAAGIAVLLVAAHWCGGGPARRRPAPGRRAGSVRTPAASS